MKCRALWALIPLNVFFTRGTGSGKEGRDRRFQPGNAYLPGQWPSEAENIAWEALPFMHAAVHVRCWVFSFLKEHGTHMEVADKTDMMLLCNFPDICQGHTLVNRDTLSAAACHLTDDSDALPSRPQAPCFARTVNDLPRRLQIGTLILPEIGGVQHPDASVRCTKQIASQPICR